MSKWQNRIIGTGEADPKQLTANPINFRKHPKRQQDAINGSLDALGWIQTVIVNKRTGRIIDGHLRVDQAIAHGESSVPVQWVDLSESEEGQALLSLDPIAAMAETNRQAMTDILKQINETQEMLAPYLEDIGKSNNIDMSDIFGKDEDDPPDESQAESFREKWGVQSGQVWELEDHRVMCGDCTIHNNTKLVIEDDKPIMMVTDPPYGVNYDPLWRKTKGLSKNCVNSGLVLNDDNPSWYQVFNHSNADVAYVWCSSLHIPIVQKDLEDSGYHIRSHIIWNKDIQIIGRGDYHWKHEPCLYAVKKGCSSKRTKDRTQNTVWDIPSINSFNNHEKLETHGTQKPIECMQKPINNHYFEYIFDPFLGSGTTLIACENLHRKCRGIEISPEYVAVTIERWHRLTGKTPHLLQ